MTKNKFSFKNQTQKDFLQKTKIKKRHILHELKVYLSQNNLINYS